MTTRECVQAIKLRNIGPGRDAAPVVERGLFDGYIAKCRSCKRGEWLISFECPTKTRALNALWQQCLEETHYDPHEDSRYCPLFDGQPATLFGG